MLTGIQITFMIFCWVTILACTGSIIYSVVDMIRARHEEKRKKQREAEREEDRKLLEFLRTPHQANYPIETTRFISQEELDKIQADQAMEMAKKKCSQQRDDNIHTDS